MFPAAGEQSAVYRLLSSGAVICRIAWLQADPDRAAQAAGSARREGVQQERAKTCKKRCFPYFTTTENPAHLTVTAAGSC